MAKDVVVNGHGCVIHPEVKESVSQEDDEYGRMFSGLSPCEVDETVVADLLVFATESTP